MKKIALFEAFSLLSIFNSIAGCGGFCIHSSVVGNNYSGLNDTIILNQGNATLYATYDGCCYSLLGPNVKIVWCLNGIPFDTNFVATINNYWYTHMETVNQTGVYTAFFVGFVGPNYQCGSVTVLKDAPPSAQVNTSSQTILTSAGSAVLSIFPNPAKDEIKIEYNFTASEKIKIKLYSVNGSEMFSLEETTEEGAFSKSIDLSEIPSGIYFMTIESASVNEKRKIVKL